MFPRLPHDLNALIDSYRDKRVVYKHERRNCKCCIPRTYVTVGSKWVQREYYYFPPPGTKQIEPGLIVAFRDYYYTGTYYYTGW